MSSPRGAAKDAAGHPIAQLQAHTARRPVLRAVRLPLHRDTLWSSVDAPFRPAYDSRGIAPIRSWVRASAMPPSPHLTGLEVETVGDVTVARFTRRSFLAPELVEALAEQMLRLVEESSCCKFVLNFANVETMTTAMVGNIVQLQKKIEDGGGRLALCNVDPFLLEIFKILNLRRVFAIHTDEASALASF